MYVYIYIALSSLVSWLDITDSITMRYQLNLQKDGLLI